MGTGIIKNNPNLNDAEISAVVARIKEYEAIPLPELPAKIPAEGTEEYEIYVKRDNFIMSILVPLEREKKVLSQEVVARDIYKLPVQKVWRDTVKKIN